MKMNFNGMEIAARVSYTLQVNQYEPLRLESEATVSFNVELEEGEDMRDVLQAIDQQQNRLYNVCWDRTKNKMISFLDELEEVTVDEEDQIVESGV